MNILAYFIRYLRHDYTTCAIFPANHAPFPRPSLSRPQAFFFLQNAAGNDDKVQ